MKLSEYTKAEREKLYKQVLDMYNSGLRRKVIAERTGLKIQQVTYIKDMFQNTDGKFFTSDKYQRLDKEAIDMLLHMRKIGMSVPAIAKETGISRSTVGYYCYEGRKEAMAKWHKEHPYHAGHTYKEHRQMLEGKL